MMRFAMCPQRRRRKRRSTDKNQARFPSANFRQTTNDVTMSGNEMGRGGAALRSTSEAGRAITSAGGCCQMGCQIRADHKRRGRDVRTQPLPPANSSRADTDRQLGWAVFVIGTEARNLSESIQRAGVQISLLAPLICAAGGDGRMAGDAERAQSCRNIASVLRRAV